MANNKLLMPCIKYDKVKYYYIISIHVYYQVEDLHRLCRVHMDVSRDQVGTVNVLLQSSMAHDLGQKYLS